MQRSPRAVMVGLDMGSRISIPDSDCLRAGMALLAVLALVTLTSRSSAQGPAPSSEARMEAARQLVGSDLFACQPAHFFEFKPNSPLGLPIGARVPYFPLLTRLKIVGVLPSVSSRIVQGLLVIVNAPGAKKMAFKTDLPLTGPLLQGEVLLKELASGEFGGLLLRIPKSFSSDQVESIQYHLVTRGMTEEEVTCALGFPEGTNDYGLGGKQPVYMGGRELIYLDSDTDKVTDIQRFDQ